MSYSLHPAQAGVLRASSEQCSLWTEMASMQKIKPIYRFFYTLYHGRGLGHQDRDPDPQGARLTLHRAAVRSVQRDGVIVHRDPKRDICNVEIGDFGDFGIDFGQDETLCLKDEI